MTNVQKEEIRQAINNYCHAKGLSKNEFATQAEVSSATLSNIEHNKWDNIADGIWRKLHIKVKSFASKVFSTQDYSAIVKLCDISRKKHYMCGLIADTGMGKTTALDAHTFSKSTYKVTFDKTLRPKQFFAALLKEMGVAFDGNIHAMVSLIADELNEQENPLIIIDEAGKLTHTMILYLQVLRDKTAKNCGIVLAGMPYFKENLIKLANKHKEGYAEFYRRINIWHQLEGLTREEIEFVCNTYDITDTAKIWELRKLKRFGDLMNEIIRIETINEN